MATVDTMPYLPFTERGAIVDGEFRWRLGLRPLDLAHWFEFGPDALGADGWIAQKQQLCADHHDTVFCALDDIEPEATEVATAIVEHLARHGHTSGGSPPRLDASLHPLDAAARLVPDDLVVMVERDGRLVFGGGSVCFPNRWDLRSKLGHTMAAVHAPVPGLNDQLGAQIDRVLDRLDPTRSFWRLGWGVIDVADGYTPLDGSARARPVDPDPAALFLRVERETLRRFATTGCVLFTIRTYVAPVGTAVRDAAARTMLADAIAAMDDGVRGYKDLATLGDALVSELTGR